MSTIEKLCVSALVAIVVSFVVVGIYVLTEPSGRVASASPEKKFAPIVAFQFVGEDEPFTHVGYSIPEVGQLVSGPAWRGTVVSVGKNIDGVVLVIVKP